MEKFLELQMDISDIKVDFSKINFNLGNFFEWLFDCIYAKLINFDDWKILLLIILAIVVLIQIKKYKKEKKMNIKLNVLSSFLIVVFVFLSINFGNVCKVEILQREWGFGTTLSTTRYSKKVKENNVIDNFKILKIEEDGVLVEYEKVVYVKSDDLENNKTGISFLPYETKKEIAQQKLLWGKTYTIKKAQNLNGIEIDGGIDYYYKFEK